VTVLTRTEKFGKNWMYGLRVMQGTERDKQTYKLTDHNTLHPYGWHSNKVQQQ